MGYHVLGFAKSQIISTIMSNDHNPESNNSSCCKTSHIAWNELVTNDLEGSSAFYTKLFGWSAAAFGPEYTLFKKAATDVAGMMKERQPGTSAQWRAYVSVEDVDDTAARAVEFGGQVLVAPMEIPDVGRIAIVSDPQGAIIGLFKPLS